MEGAKESRKKIEYLPKSLVMVLVKYYYENGQIEEDDKGGSCNVHRK